MRKISLDVPDKMYTNIKKKALEATEKQEKFVGMNDIILPVLTKEFGK